MMQVAARAKSDEPLLKVDNLVVEYGLGNKTVHAVSGVSPTLDDSALGW